MTGKRKNIFANIVISVCIVMAAIVTVAILYEYHRLYTVIPSDVLTSLLGFWGGELMIVCVRQILGSDVPEKVKTKPSDKQDGEKI